MIRSQLSRSYPAALTLAALSGLCFAAPAALAQGVVSSTNINLLPSAPPSVVEGKMTSSTLAAAFQEKQNVALTSALSVDIAKPGTYSFANLPSSGALAAGSQVDSFLFFTDPGNTNSITSFTGSLTFDRNILGLIVLSSSQDNTDSLLGAAGTTYPAGVSNRGLEFQAANGDMITLSGDDRTLNYTFNTGNSVDEVRVITNAAPVPEASTTISLGLLLALGGVLIARKCKTASSPA